MKLLARRKAGAGDAAALARKAVERVGRRDTYLPEPEIRKLPEVHAISTAPDDVRLACMHELVSLGLGPRGPKPYAARQLLAIVGRKRLEFSADDAVAIVTPALKASGWEQTAIVRAIAPQLEGAWESWSDVDRQRVGALLERSLRKLDHPPTAARLRKLLHAEDDSLPLDLVDGDDDIGPRLRAVFERTDAPKPALGELLEVLASYPESGKPSKAWRTRARKALEALPDPQGLVAALVDAALAAADTEKRHTYFTFGGNEQILCGIATAAGMLASDELLPRLRQLAQKCVTVIGGQFGSPRSLRAANAAAHAMAQVGTAAAVTELLALERAVRHGTLLREIRKSIDELAGGQGLSRGELLEQAVERHDLENDGTARIALSRGEALLEVAPTAVTLTFVAEDGKPRKSFPADVKDADAETIAEVRERMKSIRKTIAAERTRLDGLLADDRAWPLERWRELYLDHPVTGRLARALVWRAGDVVGIPIDGSAFTTTAGDAVDLPSDAEVRLWHPVTSTADDVRAWRSFLLERELAQPVKQAFREVYVLTPAEEETRVYSNRFAGHVIQQVQARALMKGRGWSPVPVAWWDDGIDHGVARRTFDAWGIRAEFFFDPILDIQPTTTDLYPYCTSDQVRFFDARSDDVVEVADVPPQCFTEAMRDVDLFVSVTSIGTDPEWLDRGEGRRFEGYWNDFAFGKLSEAATIRREVLAQLLPRLAIADRLELEDRYLVVRGDLRTYRVHLGSSNIKMSPNDQYLCIVAARDARASRLFLPFDDDPVLSAILSKAFLLANDAQIDDATIARQIRR